MLPATDPHHLSSHELVSRSLEDSIQYDQLSDAEKSRARKKRYISNRNGRNRFLLSRLLANIRNIDLFWALTAVSIGGFVCIAITLLYFRHSHQVFLHRFSHEELSQRNRTLGFDHIYVIERALHEDSPALGSTNQHKQRWQGLAQRIGIDIQTWKVPAPSPLDPKQVLLQQRECWRPHLPIYRDMLEKKYKDVLIIEDHVVFGPSIQLRLYSALMEIPADWDVLQLGPSANGTDSGHHDDVRINGLTNLKYRRVDDGACNNLAYGLSLAGAQKVIGYLDSTQAHADFEHKMLDALDRAKFLLFRVSPGLFEWQSPGSEI